MHVLTATHEGQGQRDNDFCWAVEGELVWAQPIICRKDRDDPDGTCGCGRAFAGFSSQRATTTAQVRDLSMTEDEFVLAFAAQLERAGWGSDRELIKSETNAMLTIAASYPAGAIVERRLFEIKRRLSG